MKYLHTIFQIAARCQSSARNNSAAPAQLTRVKPPVPVRTCSLDRRNNFDDEKFRPTNTGKADQFSSKLFLNDAAESEVSFPNSYDDLETPTNENIHLLDTSNMANNNFVLYKNINMNHMDLPPPSYDQIT